MERLQPRRPLARDPPRPRLERVLDRGRPTPRREPRRRKRRRGGGGLSVEAPRVKRVARTGGVWGRIEEKIMRKRRWPSVAFIGLAAAGLPERGRGRHGGSVGAGGGPSRVGVPGGAGPLTRSRGPFGNFGDGASPPEGGRGRGGRPGVGQGERASGDDPWLDSVRGSVHGIPGPVASRRLPFGAVGLLVPGDGREGGADGGPRQPGWNPQPSLPHDPAGDGSPGPGRHPRPVDHGGDRRAMGRGEQEVDPSRARLRASPSRRFRAVSLEGVRPGSSPGNPDSGAEVRQGAGAGEFHLSISSSFPTYLVSLRPIWSNHHFTVGRERDDWVVLSYSDPFTPGLLVRGSGVLPR